MTAGTWESAIAGLKTADVGEPTVFLRRVDTASRLWGELCRWGEGGMPLAVFSVINRGFSGVSVAAAFG